jgi:protein-S-isoprenylcysteine O-methyltransferase Ste14
MKQEKPKLILLFQGSLMLGIAIAPMLTGYNFFLPRDFWDWIGTVTLPLGTALVIVSVRALKKTFTIEAAVKNETKLATTFPFSFSRNPMYLGGVIMCFSWSLLQRSPLAAVLSVFLLAVLNHKVKIEELNLARVFGDEYLQYKSSVRRFF